MKKFLIYFFMYFFSFVVNTAEKNFFAINANVCFDEICGICRNYGPDVNTFWASSYGYHAHKGCYDKVACVERNFRDYLNKEGIEDKEGSHAKLHVELLEFIEKNMCELTLIQHKKMSFLDFYTRYGKEAFEFAFSNALKELICRKKALQKSSWCVIS